MTVQDGVPSEIVCTAVGSRPEVDILWYQGTGADANQPITEGITKDVTSNPDDDARSDTVSTLQYTASKDYNGGTLRCVTYGQAVAGSEEDTASLNVLCKSLVSTESQCLTHNLKANDENYNMLTDV